MLPINLIIFSIITLVFIYSKYISETENYYKNVISVTNSFSKEKVGLNYSKENVIILKNRLSEYEKTYHNKRVLYYARGDIAYILQYIFKKENVYMHRRHTYSKKYSYVPVIFETPDNFSRDELIFKYFNFEIK